MDYETAKSMYDYFLEQAFQTTQKYLNKNNPEFGKVMLEIADKYEDIYEECCGMGKEDDEEMM